ncbi:uncharacterized protein LOC134240556 [Saccostrea cucullata]|uniref:uncharacterized protein LOC134240556 n=1 Tax=Saccostrea cuccullata TaxID=36930 RepID=UPI002ED53A6F
MMFLSSMMRFTLVYIVSVITWADASSLWFCDMTDDPCEAANIRPSFEPDFRAENCLYKSYDYCDRYITPGWHRFEEDMLNHPPNLLSCGAVYPSWLNGSLPTVENEVVHRKVCKVGFESPCVKDVTIRIKHCGSFNAYCLPALDACSERYCFGEKDASCVEITSSPKPDTTPAVWKTSTTRQPPKPTNRPTTRGTTRETTKNPVLEEFWFCNEDPCMLPDIPRIPNTKNRTENCKYTHYMQSCDRDLYPGWYKADDQGQVLLDRCPGILSCGAIRPVWMQGSHPSIWDGKVQRDICTSGLSEGFNKNCCLEKNKILVKNCGRFMAYCLKPLNLCEDRYCFGKHKPCVADDDEYVKKNPLPHKNRLTENALIIAVVLSITLATIGGLVVFYLYKGQHFKRYCNKSAIYEKQVPTKKFDNDFQTLNVKCINKENDYVKLPEKSANLTFSSKC